MIKLSKLVESIEMDESKASEKAKQMGLDYMQFGRWGKDGKVTHKTQGDTVVPVKADNASEPNSATSEPRKQPVAKAQTPTPTQTPQPKAKPAFQKTGNIYRSVYNSLESTGFSGWTKESQQNLANKGLIPLTVKAASPRVWTRGDGSRYKDWTKIVPDIDRIDSEQTLKKNPNAAKDSINQYLSTIGAKSIGKVSDWSGSSDKSEVFAVGSTIFVNRGNYIEVGDKKRFKNDMVWRS